MIDVLVVSLVDDAFSLQHSPGFVSLRSFLFDFGLPVIFLFGFVISHGFSYSRGAVAPLLVNFPKANQIDLDHGSFPLRCPMKLRQRCHPALPCE